VSSVVNCLCSCRNEQHPKKPLRGEAAGFQRYRVSRQESNALASICYNTRVCRLKRIGSKEVHQSLCVE